MKVKFFTFNILHAEEEEDRLNAFLSSHRVASMQRELVSFADRAYWVITIEYPGGPVTQTGRPASQPKIDYREVLSDDDFRVFSGLRELRKEIAEREKIQLFAVFTNAQLAEMARGRARTIEDLVKIAGVGEAKLDKYGEAFVAKLKGLTGDESR